MDAALTGGTGRITGDAGLVLTPGRVGTGTDPPTAIGATPGAAVALGLAAVMVMPVLVLVAAGDGRVLAADPFAFAELGRGLFVALAGGLLVFATLFLPGGTAGDDAGATRRGGELTV
jgi:hypothetical protein